MECRSADRRGDKTPLQIRVRFAKWSLLQADIFLTKRDPRHLERNALVGIFLRRPFSSDLPPQLLH
jgi:hypothetical protein